MFSLGEMPKTASTFFSAYASFAATMMLIRSMANDLVPPEIRSYIYSIFHHLFRGSLSSSSLTMVFEENCGMTRNQVFDSAEIYLRTKISPSTNRLMVSKTEKQKNFTVMFDKGEEIADIFEDLKLKWRFVYEEPKDQYSRENKYFELSFNKKYKEKVLGEYLPCVVNRAEDIRNKEKMVKLYNRDCPQNYEDEFAGGNGWGCINLEHPATFETLAMDPEMKKMIIDDLDRFMRRKEYYKKVGKAWKRGYLLYGPPGTGKSSLIAAMANYLNFDIYDLDLKSVYSNSDLRRTLLSTTNRSILVIEDIDCNAEVQDRQGDGHQQDSDKKLTLSGILNTFDGLLSSTGDERVIVFTTNHKDRLDPALLRPGRMDMHINLSYCTVQGFRILASNYLDVHGEHHLLEEIEGLIQCTDITPAEVAEEIMRTDDADVALEGLVKFLKRKNTEVAMEREKERKIEGEDNVQKLQNDDNDEKKLDKNRNKRRNLRQRKRQTRKHGRYWDRAT
ncbi:ATP-dependent zinc metalloprotease FTSH 2 chloroplastic-like isoform X1 [Tripterygium wilfordii]|uniref:ATP-dependent zinc metalloprotease FTSH 2 chloroplastic-like isoform X1 n=1 Tax=Tripterygium wilfordii TaxID=458696 RepID=A0A7J7CQ46_TRIWF|nr:AAA-ATPase At2g18193-like [Tripterygium wilfordii]KAF5736006.1 ATP-dependent zinc metalloprotease FTSH 2 chloroplastic-like isoform X1 [Tripterygium wilfordii]